MNMSMQYVHMPEYIRGADAIIQGQRFIIHRTTGDVKQFLQTYRPKPTWTAQESAAHRFGDLRVARAVAKLLAECSVVPAHELVISMVDANVTEMRFSGALETMRRLGARRAA